MKVILKANGVVPIVGQNTNGSGPGSLMSGVVFGSSTTCT